MIEFINWKNLSFFGENKIINRSYVYLFIVPVLAKLLSKIKSPVNLKIGGQDFTFVFELPFSWKMFFFSALLFTLGSLLYSFFSPLIIKENKSYGDFIEQKKNFSHIIRYLDNLQITNNWIEKLGINLSDARGFNIENSLRHLKASKFQFINNRIKKKVMIFNKTHSDRINYSEVRNVHQEEAFWRLYNFANQSRPFWLTIATIFYIGGFVLISLVLFQGIKLVLNI